MRRKVVYYFTSIKFSNNDLKETAIHIINECLFFLLCGMLILLFKRNRFCLLLIQSMFSLCTTLHTAQGGSYFSHSFHATSFQLEEWFYKVYVLKSAKIILNFSECNCCHYTYIVPNKTSLFSPAITRAKASLNIN